MLPTELQAAGIQLVSQIAGSILYEGGPTNSQNLNVARELEVVARCAARCHEPRQYSSYLSLGVDLG
jgi:hypothetical protein